MVRILHFGITTALCLVLTVTASVFAQTGPCNCSRDSLQNGARIDPAVHELLAADGTAKVLVFLNEDAVNGKLTALAQRRLQVRDRQNALLSGLTLARKHGNTAGFDFKVDELYAYSNSVSGWITARGLKRLARHPLVKEIIADPAMVPELMESIPQIGADAVWSRPAPAAATGKGSVVFIIDTGVDYTHPAFGGCTRAQILAGTCPRVRTGYDIHDNDDDPMDYYGHGTHVAGIVASEIPGVEGVAPGAVIVPVKICSDGGVCAASKMLAGLEWCLDWYLAHSSEFTTAVVTTSISIPYAFTNPVNPGWFDALLSRMRDAGMSLVVPSGNQGSTTGISYPACSPYTLSVGSVNTADEVSSFGNRDPRLDLWAPGVSIYAPLPNNTYGIKTGTSASAPHAAGAVALLGELAARVSGTPWTPEALYGLLKNTGTPVTDAVSGLTVPRLSLPAAADSLLPVAAPVTHIRVTVPPVGEAVEEAAFSMEVAVDSAAGDYVISLAGAPEWIHLAGDMLVGTPDDGDGDATFSIIVSDGISTDTTEMTVTVEPVNDRPAIVSAPAEAACENSEYRYSVHVEDPDDENNGEELLWSLLSAPAGMSIDEHGVISWTPPEGTYSSGLVTVLVRDGGENWSWGDLQSFIIGVEPDNGTPELLSATADTADANVPYLYLASAFDAEEVPAIRFTGFPEWMDTCGQVIAGVPPFAGRTSFTIICSDGVNEVTEKVALAIRDQYGRIPTLMLTAMEGTAEAAGNRLAWSFSGTKDAPVCNVFRSNSPAGPFLALARNTVTAASTAGGTCNYCFTDGSKPTTVTYYRIRYADAGRLVDSSPVRVDPYVVPVADSTGHGTDPVSAIAYDAQHTAPVTVRVITPAQSLRAMVTAGNGIAWTAGLYDLSGRALPGITGTTGNGHGTVTGSIPAGHYVLTVTASGTSTMHHVIITD